MYSFVAWNGSTIAPTWSMVRAAPDGIGTPMARHRDACWRSLDGVIMGLLATAAVADMPVGEPHPFASALEPSSRRHADKRGTAWLSRMVKA